MAPRLLRSIGRDRRERRQDVPVPDQDGALELALWRDGAWKTCTGKPDPKDADLLVTVADDMDLTLLATLGRKLQGHAQSFARGGEVFLADPQGHYLGRTCPWKRCGPGIRISCDALHCGRRPYLHDDLETIRLDEGLVVAPPIELWPQVVTRVSVPGDVERELLLPLREDLGG